jgi:hypothetical protein
MAGNYSPSGGRSLPDEGIAHARYIFEEGGISRIALQLLAQTMH